MRKWMKNVLYKGKTAEFGDFQIVVHAIYSGYKFSIKNEQRLSNE
jgi:hypothetical protein